MPSLSQKSQLMPSSPIRKLAPFAEKAKKEGKKIYHLNIGQPDIETPPIFWETLKKLDKKVLEYSPSNGYERLRVKYADFFNNQYNIKLNADEILITCGASEALLFSFFSILDEGDEIIATDPIYANYIGFANAGGINLVSVTTNISDGFALPDMATFEKAITPKTKAILICNPSNPTGYSYTVAELDRLRDIALKHDLFIISDEVYRDFVYDGQFKSILEYKELEQHVILIDSLSKRFSITGGRIGMVASKNKDVIAAILKFAQQRLSPPGLAQEASIGLFDLKSDYFLTVKAEYLARRNVLVAGLNQIPGVICPNPGGAFYCMVQFPVKDTDHYCQWLLESFDYEGETVMMAPGGGFYVHPENGKNQVRVAYVLNSGDLEKAILILSKSLETYKEQFG